MKQRGLYQATCRSREDESNIEYTKRLRDITFNVVADDFGEAGRLAQQVYEQGKSGAFAQYFLFEVELRAQVFET